MQPMSEGAAEFILDPCDREGTSLTLCLKFLPRGFLRVWTAKTPEGNDDSPEGILGLFS